MSRQLLICLLALCSFAGYGQEKPTLTKEETINYLNKKIKEAEGFWRHPPHLSKNMYYKSMRFTLQDHGVSIEIQSVTSLDPRDCSSYVVRETSQVFNPAHIKSVSLPSASEINTSESIGLIAINLQSSTAKDEQYYKWYEDGYCSRECGQSAHPIEGREQVGEG